MQEAPAPQVLRFGDFEADLVAGELRRRGLKVRLQERPFQLLILLLLRAGQVVTREELRQALWPADTFVDFDNSINTAVNKLRTALGDTAGPPGFIERWGGRGYPFGGGGGEAAWPQNPPRGGGGEQRGRQVEQR